MKRSVRRQTPRRAPDPRDAALARWDGEGGAGPSGSLAAGAAGNGPSHRDTGASAELVQLRIRVIALENLVITLLAEGPAQQLLLARSMAVHVSPRPGFTHHRPTLHAASQMRHLIKRAAFFRATTQRRLELD